MCITVKTKSADGDWERIRKYLLVSCWLILTAMTARPTPIEKPAQKPEKTVYDYSLVDLDGKEVSLSVFKGKVLLIVNLASQSIFRDQIALLDEPPENVQGQRIGCHRSAFERFRRARTGTDAEVQKQYTGDLHLSFPSICARICPRQRSSGSVRLSHR